MMSRSVVESVRLEHSDKYGYLYFFFPNGRVIGIPVNGTDETLCEGVESLTDAVITSRDNMWTEEWRD